MDMDREAWLETSTETLADYYADERADLSDIDPIELTLFLACIEHAPRLASWFFHPAFAIVCREWLLERSVGDRNRLALLLRVGLASGGRVLTWREVGASLGVVGSRVQESAPRGLISFWLEYGTIEEWTDTTFADAKAAIRDITTDDTTRGIKPTITAPEVLGPSRRDDLWHPEYAETCREATVEQLYPWRLEDGTRL